MELLIQKCCFEAVYGAHCLKGKKQKKQTVLSRPLFKKKSFSGYFVFCSTLTEVSECKAAGISWMFTWFKTYL